MKNPYFTEETIKNKTQEIIEWLTSFRQIRHPELKSETSAVVVLDMQRYFLDKTSHAYIPSAHAIVPGVIRLLTAYIERDLPVVLTRHINTDDDAGMLSKWWSDVITLEGGYSELIPELAGLPSTTVVEKTRYDAFYRTNLDEYLRRLDVEQVVICGVMTHLCCETTARSAFVRDYEVFFAVDGTATYTEEHHRATLLNLAHGFAHPVTIDELLTDIEEAI
jgi:isochorismate hydrolase